MALRDPGRVLPMFAAAGFGDERATPLQVDMHHPGGVRAVTDLMTRIGPVSRMLRDRGTDADREAIADDLRRHVWPMVEAGKLRPVMDQEFALADAAAAHRRMEQGDHIGKIVLRVAGED